MEMKKKNLIISISVIIFLVLITIAASFWYWYYFVKEKYLTNINELYSFFTPTMEKFVNLHLESIECPKSKYYYNNSYVCFVCGKFDACFSFSSVKRGPDIKMNPAGNFYLTGKYDNLTALHFYSSGIDKFLNCNDKLECENGIKAKIENNIVTNLKITYNGTSTIINNTLNGTFAVFEFPSTFSISDINSEIIKLANKLGYGKGTCNYFLDFIRSCDSLIILWVDNNNVIFFRD
jgi:hypothetical protein